MHAIDEARKRRAEWRLFRMTLARKRRRELIEWTALVAPWRDIAAHPHLFWLGADAYRFT